MRRETWWTIRKPDGKIVRHILAEKEHLAWACSKPFIGMREVKKIVQDMKDRGYTAVPIEIEVEDAAKHEVRGKMKKKSDYSESITRSEIVCKNCGTKKKSVRPRKVYRIDDGFAKGYYTISQPYCDECYEALPDYED